MIADTLRYQSSNASGSAPTTPKAETAIPIVPPPVPVIPSSFVYNPSAPVGYLPTPPAFPTSSSGQLRDFGFAFDTPSSSSRNGIPSSAPAVGPKGAARDYFSPTGPVDRRRSLSFNSLSTTKASQPVSSAPKDPVRSAEDEQIRTELHRWKMELDGVIGSIGNKSPVVGGGRSPRISKSPPRDNTRKLSIPTPLPPSQSSPNLVSLRPDRTLSAPGRTQTTPPLLSDNRPPSWDATWSDTLSPSPLLSTNAASFEHATPTEQQVDTPKIRLSSPVTTDDGLMEETGEQVPTPARRNSVAMDGLGLGLETITESSHSRENSLATPYVESPVDALSPTDATRSLSPIPSTSAANSPLLPSSSTNSLQSSFSSTLASRKAAMRQSVVVYPTGKSFNFSSESLKKSTSIPASPIINAPDSPAGLSFEERAREFAQRCWDEDETFLDPKKIAEWLGTTLVSPSPYGSMTDKSTAAGDSMQRRSRLISTCLTFRIYDWIWLSGKLQR